MRDFFSAYPKANGRFDELQDASGRIRPHWKTFMEAVAASRSEQMRRRISHVQRQIFENGVTYNVYADPQGTVRPWDLDLLPLILSPEEWHHIQAGVRQRAMLLNLILKDIYGEQRLLHEGLLPPALVHGHNGFLRSAHGIPSPDGVYLHLYAVDLARSPDGGWWVLADRTQAPSGAGYALENRLVISRVFPDLFRQLKVEHLAGFFHTLQQSLSHWAPIGQSGEPPRIVVLTPGPYNETYFEHAYLARYLGFPLVEGHDLTVREGRVWLKSLEGLQRVHVILRRLDDDFCDPLEFRADSALGIPGLAQAARLGQVLIANALGSSLLESSAFFGYFPSLCQHLLGESLRMPSVATWWCGERAALEDALHKLDGLVIKGAFPQLRMDTLFGADLSPRERERLILRIRQRPYNYVAQETVQLSQAPSLERGGLHRLHARAMGLRVHVVASPEGYVVMPGGLTRIAGDGDERVIALQRGGASKDTWVLSHTPVSTFSLLPRSFHVRDIVRSGANLSSRVVENLFWFGRYTERCDNIARLLRMTINRFLEDASFVAGPEEPEPYLLALCRVYGLLTSATPAQPAASGEPSSLSKEPAHTAAPRSRDSLKDALLAGLVDTTAHESFAAHLGYLTRVGFSLKERLSLDNWRTLNRLTQALEEQRILQRQEANLGEALIFLDQAVNALMTLAGFAMDGMTRDVGWHFLSLGRRLERLQFLVSMLRHGQVESGSRLPREGKAARIRREWRALEEMLELADSVVTYRSRYMMQPEFLSVLDLLVLDDTNPRSLLFQLHMLREECRHLESRFGGTFAAALERVQHDLTQPNLMLTLTDHNSSVFGELLETLWRESCQLSERIGQRFFSHVAEQRTGT